MSRVVKSVHTMVSDRKNILTIPVLRVIPPIQPSLDAAMLIAPEDVCAEAEDTVELPENLLEQARIEAETLLETARKEAESIMAASEMQAEEIRQQADLQAADIQAAAEQAGFQAGYEAGRSAAEADYKRLLEQSMALLQSVEDEKKQYLRQAQHELVELACAISSKIMNRQLELEGSWVLETVKDALAEIVDPSRIEIYAHPHDIPLLAEHRSELLPQQSVRAELQFKPDSSIERGGCILRTKQGSVDARIDTQVIEVKRALLDIAANL